MCGGYVLVVKYRFNSPPFSSISLPVLSAVSRTAADEEIVLSLHEGCDPVAGGRPVRTSRGQAQDVLDGAPFRSSEACAAMSERTFQGRQAINSVQVFCKASSASSSGRAELLSTQGAIAVDSRYIELGRSGLKANLNLKQENCVPASPLFRHLAARGTRRGLRGTPSSRPSRLVLGTATPAARLPCWGHELGSAVLFNLVYGW